MINDFAPVEHVLQSRQGKCKGLATASLGNSDNISATSDDRPALRLDWGGLLKVFHHAHDLPVSAEVSKVLNGFVGLAQSSCWENCEIGHLLIVIVGANGLSKIRDKYLPLCCCNVKQGLEYLSSSSCASLGKPPLALLEWTTLLWLACRRSF